MSEQPAVAIRELQDRLTANLEIVGQGIKLMARNLNAAMRQIGQVLTRARPQIQAAARAQRGGIGSLVGDWQTSQCAGWLHSSCDNNALIDCRCTCHGGSLR